MLSKRAKIRHQPAQSAQSIIARMMFESMTGDESIQRSTIEDPNETDLVGVSISSTGGEEGCEEGYCDQNEQEGYTEEELKLAKRFSELVGGPDRAREILDKVADCEECLDLVDDEPEEGSSGFGSDEEAITHLASMMPDSPDLPTSFKNNMNLSSLYNPNPTAR